jgi:ketosteroid isomerase-like protein
MADEATVRSIVKRYFEYVGADVDRADEIYHEDAVLEFPQSGERFEGVATFTEWRRQYPADADKMRFKLRRATVRVDRQLSSYQPLTMVSPGCRVSSCWSSAPTRSLGSGSM